MHAKTVLTNAVPSCDTGKSIPMVRTGDCSKSAGQTFKKVQGIQFKNAEVI